MNSAWEPGWFGIALLQWQVLGVAIKFLRFFRFRWFSETNEKKDVSVPKHVGCRFLDVDLLYFFWIDVLARDRSKLIEYQIMWR